MAGTCFAGARRMSELAAILIAVSLLVSEEFGCHAHNSEEQFQRWLKLMSETSDPVSDESVHIAAAEFASRPMQGESSHLTGFDAWMAKSNEEMTKFQSTGMKSTWDSNSWQTIYVAQDGSGDFSTITDALASIPQQNSDRKIIFVKAGTYYERFEIPESQKYIALVGEGADKSIISGDAKASDMDGDDFLKTFRSCTVGVNSDHFVAKNILIQVMVNFCGNCWFHQRFMDPPHGNPWPPLEDMKNTSPPPEPGAIGEQAVALRISGDKAAFYNVAFLGAQDTLYDHKGRHFFLNCFIQGSIDFIFGNGRSFYKIDLCLANARLFPGKDFPVCNLLKDCHLHSIASSFGSLTAQKRNETTQNTGFSFVNAQVDGTGIIYLGRAWGNYSRVVYSWSYLSDMITPEGWQDWGLPQRDTEVFYAEYQCYGPGSYNPQTVWWATWLSDEQAKPFLTDAFINGHSWIEDQNNF